MICFAEDAGGHAGGLDARLRTVSVCGCGCGAIASSLGLVCLVVAAQALGLAIWASAGTEGGKATIRL